MDLRNIVQKENVIIEDILSSEFEPHFVDFESDGYEWESRVDSQLRF